jgi:hypothetical protein
MKLKLQRRDFTDNSTIGAIYVDNIFQCYTLEDTDRHLEDGNAKIYGQTAIPRGRYQVIITYSNRFKKELPLLQNVPGFTGVRIHSGNGPDDTEGCILVGTGISSNKADWLLNSRAAFSVLFDRIDSALLRGEEVTLEIV